MFKSKLIIIATIIIISPILTVGKEFKFDSPANINNITIQLITYIIPLIAHNAHETIVNDNAILDETTTAEITVKEIMRGKGIIFEGVIESIVFTVPFPLFELLLFN